MNNGQSDISSGQNDFVPKVLTGNDQRPLSRGKRGGQRGKSE
jgi:hypothetical protein